MMSTSAVRQQIVIKNVTIIGAGQMGSGIAQVAAQTDHKVTLVDVNDEVLKRSKENIQRNLARVAKKKFSDAADAEKFTSNTLKNLTLSSEVKAAVSETDVVIEAIVENLEAKQKLFADLDKLAPKQTLFVSNTSSYYISKIASVTSRQDRFGGMHFFNPVPVMKLVEVVRTPAASNETYDALVKFGQALGKTTVEAKDTMGFIVNRLLVPLFMEAIRMIERGDATAKDIDTAMKLGLGHPMGPVELNDFCGLDINKAVNDGWHAECPENPLFNPSPLLNKLVSEGKFGVKTGEGFYKYNKKS